MSVTDQSACECGGAGECCAGHSCALAELGHNECAVVHANELPAAEAAFLRAMGLREQSRVRICRKGQPCIVEVAGAGGSYCRVGIAKELALRVMVRREGGALRAVGAARPSAPVEALVVLGAPALAASGER